MAKAKESRKDKEQEQEHNMKQAENLVKNAMFLSFWRTVYEQTMILGCRSQKQSNTALDRPKRAPRKAKTAREAPDNPRVAPWRPPGKRRES